LVALSPFGDEVERASPWHGSFRNDIVVAMSEVVFVPHAIQGGKVFGNVLRAINRGQVVLTLDDKANEHLMAVGAHPISVAGVVSCAMQLGGKSSAGP